MATPSARTPTGKSSRAGKIKSGLPKKQAAVALLKADHKAVDELFKAYEKAKSDTKKARLSAQICAALKVHAQIEEEIFYPALRGEIDDDQLDEAKVEHASAKDLIAQIEAMAVGDELYDAKVAVLGEYIRHHVREEETEMFPDARKADLDLRALGQQLAARKAELELQMKAQVQ